MAIPIQVLYPPLPTAIHTITLCHIYYNRRVVIPCPSPPYCFAAHQYYFTDPPTHSELDYRVLRIDIVARRQIWESRICWSWKSSNHRHSSSLARLAFDSGVLWSDLGVSDGQRPSLRRVVSTTFVAFLTCFHNLLHWNLRVVSGRVRGVGRDLHVYNLSAPSKTKHSDIDSSEPWSFGQIERWKIYWLTERRKGLAKCVFCDSIVSHKCFYWHLAVNYFDAHHEISQANFEALYLLAWLSSSWPSIVLVLYRVS